MRTNVVIENELMERALSIGGYKTKKAAIAAGLKLLVQFKSQEKLRSLRGKVRWEGDLERMRTNS
ncbi:MAG TPA: type II toxin-antitoxin system VapB family antitoxin [Spirochaetales bacterium]|nr:type II toxin-antitoxin system VapB family antitoxin [Spirochaetales bacterium]